MLIKNASIILEDKILNNGWILIENGKITGLGTKEQMPLGYITGEILDAKNNLVAPGLIDIHTHGISGYSILTAQRENDILKLAQNYLKFGVTSFLPTTVSLPIAMIENILNLIKKFKNSAPIPPPHPSQEGICNVNANSFNFIDSKNTHAGTQIAANIIGVNLEGPYINIEKKGAHLPSFIKNISMEEFISLQENFGDIIKIITVAPELPSAIELIQFASQQGIIVSLGHSNAIFEETKKAINQGAVLCTHIFNAMRGYEHREPGIVGACLADDKVYTEVIVDGIHLHDFSVKLLLKQKPLDKIILITDSIPQAGLSDGEFALAGLKVIVKNGEAKLENGIFAGSTLTLNKSVYNMTKMNIGIVESIKMATLNPARLLGIDKNKGSIAADKDADIVVFDKKFNPINIIKNGKNVYNAE